MTYRVQTAVVGCAIRPRVADSRRSLEELIYDTAGQALADAGMGFDDLDGIVVGCNDQFDGRAISVMMASGPTGGVDRDILSTPSASEHAFVMGALRVSSGQFRTQLVMAWSPTEASSLAEAQRLGTDPYFHRALPLDELSAHALQAGALQAALADTPHLASAVAEKNRAHGHIAYPDSDADQRPGPARWPLSSQMTTQPVAGCVALVLAAEGQVRRRPGTNAAWVRGIGWSTEPPFLGDRRLDDAPALRAAARMAYSAAGVIDPLRDFDVAEITDATPHAELLAYEALGLCERDAWGRQLAQGTFGRGGALPVNLSGGVLTHNPVFCTGLLRIAEIAQQIRGRCGAHQVGGARLGLAHAGSGFAMQYQAAIVLGREQENRA